jgi:hypothetical protein
VQSYVATLTAFQDFLGTDIVMILILDGPRRRNLISWSWCHPKRVPSRPDERESTGIVCAPFFRYQRLLIPSSSYDFFKSELLKTKYFEDNIYCHFTASFAAVRPSPLGSVTN